MAAKYKTCVTTFVYLISTKIYNQYKLKNDTPNINVYR